jgi:hypothetical protein
MKKPAILLLSFYLLSFVSRAQNITGSNNNIPDSTAGSFVATPLNLPFFTSSTEGEKIIASIMDAVGLEGNFEIKAADVPNVEATIRHHRRYILYNPQFIKSVNATAKDKWACIFILAHEVGHHLEGHTLAEIKNRPAIELQADQFAGFTLCKMRATLEQAQLAMHFIANINGSKTHPARADRLLAIKKGWKKAEAQMKNPGISTSTF